MPNVTNFEHSPRTQSSPAPEIAHQPGQIVVQALDARSSNVATSQSTSTAQPSADNVSPIAAEDDTTAGDVPNVLQLSRFCQALACIRRHAVLPLVCLASLLIGGGLAIWLRPTLRPTAMDVPAAIPPVAKSLVYASTLRRHEPIQPLIPFDDLDPAVVDLGQRLFHEPALSSNGRMSCASCHPLDSGGTLHVPLPQGVNGEAAPYNAPTVLNAALNCAQLWVGSVASLEAQINEPICNPHELGSSWERVIKFLSLDPHYRQAFPQVLDGAPTPERVRTALAVFQRSLITVNSKFDQWLRGTESALTSDEFGGYYLFKKFNCIACHQGVGVGGSMFQPLGVVKKYFSKDASPADWGRFNFTEQERDRHVFRVPQLRNVELTAPYFHDGSVATLEQAVALMIEYQCGQEFHREDVRRLTAFLKSLTGELPVAARAGSLSSNANPQGSNELIQQGKSFDANSVQ